MKKVHKILKYRKKDNDYGLWMKQEKLFPVISNLGCMALDYVPWTHFIPSVQLKRWCSFKIKKSQMPEIFF